MTIDCIEIGWNHLFKTFYSSFFLLNFSKSHFWPANICPRGTKTYLIFVVWPKKLWNWIVMVCKFYTGIDNNFTLNLSDVFSCSVLFFLRWKVAFFFKIKREYSYGWWWKFIGKVERLYSISKASWVMTFWKGVDGNFGKMSFWRFLSRKTITEITQKDIFLKD